MLTFVKNNNEAGNNNGNGNTIGSGNSAGNNNEFNVSPDTELPDIELPDVTLPDITLPDINLSPTIKLVNGMSSLRTCADNSCSLRSKSQSS
jgi:hypothetical protein